MLGRSLQEPFGDHEAYKGHVWVPFFSNPPGPLYGCQEVATAWIPPQASLSSSTPGPDLMSPRQETPPRPPNVPLLRALWSLLVGIWGFLKGSWGVLAPREPELAVTSHQVGRSSMSRRPLQPKDHNERSPRQGALINPEELALRC